MTRRFHTYSLLTGFMLAMVVAGLPAPAYAISLGSCSGMPPHDIVGAIVMCVQISVQTSAGIIYGILAGWMSPIVGAMFALSVAIMGMRIAGGDPGALRHAGPLVIKMGMLTIYTTLLGSIGSLAFSLMNTLAVIGGGGTSPWGLVDYFLKMIFGYGPSLALYQGLLGLVTASLFSGAVGVAVFIAGYIAIMSMIKCISRIIFIYLAAVVVVGFMVAISPLFIPMILFNVTDTYFRQWLNITLAAIIQPMLLFAVCSMFLGIFPSLVINIFTVIGGNDFRHIWRWNQPLMSWITPGDPALQKHMDEQPDGSARERVPAIPSYVNPLFADAPGMSLYKVPKIDFGLDHIAKMQELLVAFVALMLFSMLMKTMTELMPQIAEDITGAAIGLGSVSAPIEQMQDKMIKNVQSEGLKSDDIKVNTGGKNKGSIGNAGMTGKR